MLVRREGEVRTILPVTMCCTVTLRQILDLVNGPESLSRILGLLELQQEPATDVEAQMYMYILVHKATLMVEHSLPGHLSECFFFLSESTDPI
jgi:hypothetical protein